MASKKKAKQAVSVAKKAKTSSPNSKKPSASSKKPSAPSKKPSAPSKKPSAPSNKKPSSTTQKKQRIADLTKKARDLIKSGKSPKDLISRLKQKGADNRVDALRKLRDKLKKKKPTGEQAPETPDGNLNPIDDPNYPISTVGDTDITDIYGDPDSFDGSTPAEMDYATLIDPYKIEAKSRERLGALQAGLGGYLGRLQAASSERINRANRGAELLGSKLAYGTEYDINKVNRLSALQQAKTQQATSLYNLIPSAFG
jgi:hypothetical protein